MSEWLSSCALLASVVVRTTVESAAKADATWLQTYGQLIGVAIGAVLTGSVALLLAVMNNRSSDRRLKMTQAHDLQRESQRITRERLEELYVQAGHWTSGLDLLNINSLRLAKGLLTFHQHADLVKAHGEKSQLQKSRMELLFDVYGTPEIHAGSQAVREAETAFMKRFQIVSIIAQTPDRLREVTPSKAAATPKIYEELDTLASEVSAKGRALLAMIAAQAKS